MPDAAVTIFAETEKQTQEFGRALPGLISKGDIVLLSGRLGAGKSVLVRSIIRNILNQPELEVPSPTYLLVLPYEGEGEKAGWSILHADLYRLEKEEEMEELGLFDDPQTVVLIEWPERAPELEQMAQLRVGLSIPPSGEGRLIEVASSTGLSELKKAAAQFPAAP